MLDVKILGIRYPERYAVRRLVALAQQELLPQHPHLEVEISEVSDPAEIGRHAQVLILPTLLINDKTACSGRFPTREEVVGWLREALEKS